MYAAISCGRIYARHLIVQALTRVLFSLFIAVAGVGSAIAGQITLAWNASPSAAVAGYMVHYGTVSGNYTGKADASKTTSYTVPNLAAGKTYYYAVTAYDSTRRESGYSNEVSAKVPVGAPTASFTANRTSGAAPLPVAFTSTSTGSINSYSWDFGDGAKSALQNPTHSFAAGVYTVTLKVTGSGGSTTFTKGITATAPTSSGAPVAKFSTNKTSGPAALTVKFTSTATGGISGYQWVFGDGTYSIAQNPTHTYSKAGTYTVNFRVTGSGGSNMIIKKSYITVW